MLGENAARASIGLMNIFRIQLGNKQQVVMRVPNA